MSRIHPTAIVDPQAALDPTVEVGPYAIIEGQVTVGAETIIGPHAWIRRGTTIGRANHIHYGAIIGHWPQDLAFTDEDSYVRIGDENQIREYVTIHRGTTPGSATVVGNHCFLMAMAHLGHNCHVGSHVIIANSSTLGGYVVVEDHAFISAQCVVHQFARIGRLALLSGMTGVGQDVCPFFMAAMRNQVVGINVVGLRRAGIAPAARAEIKQAFKLLYRSGLSIPHALEELERTTQSAEVQHLIAFARASQRGLCPYRGQKTQNLNDETALEASGDSG